MTKRSKTQEERDAADMADFKKKLAAAKEKAAEALSTDHVREQAGKALSTDNVVKRLKKTPK